MKNNLVLYYMIYNNKMLKEIMILNSIVLILAIIFL